MISNFKPLKYHNHRLTALITEINKSKVGFNIWYVRLPSGELTKYLEWTSQTGGNVRKLLRDLPDRLNENGYTYLDNQGRAERVMFLGVIFCSLLAPIHVTLAFFLLLKTTLQSETY